MVTITDELALAEAAVRLGAPQVAGWSAAEQRLAEAAGQAVGTGLGRSARTGRIGPSALSEIARRIRAGEDPLGDAFCRLRPPAQRRVSGQTFTPAPVVDSMVAWAARAVAPARVVDPGTGSGRFLLAAGRRWPSAVLTGAETDPLAALISRAALAVTGLAGRSQILVSDYRTLRLPPAGGPTLFLGNPPYVRHHQVPPVWKDWLRAAAASQGLTASGLAGLHAHFFLATALHAVPGDAGALLTAAEWLDVNYGSVIRELLLGSLGGEAVHLLDPALPLFADAAATSAITCFRPGRPPAALRLRRVAGAAGLGDLSGGRPVPVADLRTVARWGELMDRRTARPGRLPAGQVELGELCRVHRGQVTGANKVWITSAGPASSGPASSGPASSGPASSGPGVPHRFLFPAITRAAELFRAPGVLASTSGLRCVIDLPPDLGGLAGEELALVTAFLARAQAAGAAEGYVARHRTPWWRVRLAAPAPILATYMARRPPAFVRNLAGARHVNIAHGLYPREPLSAAALDGLAAFLRGSVSPGQGRTYAGGLVKFEPREMERLPVPAPGLLPARATRGGATGNGATEGGAGGRPSDPAVAARVVPHPGQPGPV